MSLSATSDTDRIRFDAFSDFNHSILKQGLDCPILVIRDIHKLTLNQFFKLSRSKLILLSTFN